ncbi:MAG: L-threonylcarbamoyladenylate synthase, partial [Chloroflexota bacterium]|nr:L-threonylcarbamoyladenylate synthase [Chloroflexota bacterium]
GPVVLPATDPGALAEAVLAMRSGGIVGIPTETVYGIAVVPQPEALKAVIRAKQRPEDKGIALLIDGLDQVDGLVEVSTSARQLAERCWPGALTLVLPLRRPGLVPDAITGGRDTLGLRVPDHPVPRALARELGPIAVTSANRSGELPARTAAELIDAVGASLALVLDDGPVRGGVASTIVALVADGSWSVLREGALDRAAIRTALEEG